MIWVSKSVLIILKVNIIFLNPLYSLWLASNSCPASRWKDTSALYIPTNRDCFLAECNLFVRVMCTNWIEHYCVSLVWWNGTVRTEWNNFFNPYILIRYLLFYAAVVCVDISSAVLAAIVYYMKRLTPTLQSRTAPPASCIMRNSESESWGEPVWEWSVVAERLTFICHLQLILYNCLFLNVCNCY